MYWDMRLPPAKWCVIGREIRWLKAPKTWCQSDIRITPRVDNGEGRWQYPTIILGRDICMDESQNTRICLFCGARVKNLELHYVETHQSTPTETTRVCLYCGARVINLELHYLETHQSTDVDTTWTKSAPMSSRKRTILALVFTGLALACLWGVVGTFTADTHEVCISGGRSVNSPGGECFRSYVADGPAPIGDRLVDSIIFIVISGICGVVAWGFWKDPE